MDNELNELYQQVILDQNKNPRNFGTLDHCTHEAEGFNPLCGDKFDVQMEIDGNVIKKIMFKGSGCAISKASASIMTTIIEGKTVEEAEKYFEIFHDLITSAPDAEIDEEALGKIAVLAGVREYPSRIKCANLAWHTMHNAIIENHDTVTTDK